MRASKFRFFRPSTYRESIPGCNTQEFAEKVAHLKKEISKLDDYENLLDRHRLWVEQSIVNVTEDIDTRRYLYVMHEDFVECFGTDNTTIVVNAPCNTNMSVQVSFLFICRYIGKKLFAGQCVISRLVLNIYLKSFQVHPLF